MQGESKESQNGLIWKESQSLRYGQSHLSLAQVAPQPGVDVFPFLGPPAGHSSWGMCCAAGAMGD